MPADTKLAELLVPIEGPVRLRLSADKTLAKHKNDLKKSLREFLALVQSDAGQFMALFDIKPADIERRALQFLQNRMHETTPRDVVGHKRRPHTPLPEKLEEQRKAAMKVATFSADVKLMVIDGRDIREWTIGQCRTTARKKGHEAYVLRVIGNQLAHFEHTDLVSKHLSDRDIASIVAQGKEAGRDIG